MIINSVKGKNDIFYSQTNHYFRIRHAEGQDECYIYKRKTWSNYIINWLIGDKSPTGRRPVPHPLRPIYDQCGGREVSLAASKSYRPCDLCNLTETAPHPECDRPGSRSQKGRKLGYKLYVTGI